MTASLDSVPVVTRAGMPIVIETLGTYSVLVQGRLVTPRGKTGELLRAVLALGGSGASVPQARLSAALWPDSEGPAARRALDTTLHRLRKGLGAPEAILLREGRVFIDASRCFIDSVAFESAARNVLGRDTWDDDSSLHVAHRALGLYKGVFLEEFEEEPCLAGRRGAVHARFLRFAQEFGRRREALGDFDRALDVYEHAVGIDPLHEPLHQGVLRCLGALGRRVERQRAFERCQNHFHRAFECAPSSETRLLAGDP